MLSDPILVLDSLQGNAIPLHFRKTDGAYLKPAEPTPPRTGLEAVRSSGSHQFSLGELKAVAGELPPGATVVDLRQESHGLVNGMAVSWYSPKDFANVGKSLLVIDADEDARLEALKSSGEASILIIEGKDEEGEITASKNLHITVDSVSNEAHAAASLGLSYVRIPVTDHARPSDADTDAFLALWRATMPGGWLHFHCHAGEGRTTTFMAMADMLVNARQVGFEDILRRQAQLGGLDLFIDHPGWKTPYSIERREFLRRFHAYASANPGGRPLLWSQWINTSAPAA